MLSSIGHQSEKRIPDIFYRLSVARYHKMIESGIFDEDDAVELLEGQIIKKMPKDRLHVIVTNLIVQVLTRVLLASDQYHVQSQEPITLKTSEPEPDVAIIRGRMLDYKEHPKGENVALVVEVANTSLAQDQSWKKEIYADAGIPIYWIANLQEMQIDVYSKPTTNKAYLEHKTFKMGDTIQVVVDGEKIGDVEAASLFPND